MNLFVIDNGNSPLNEQKIIVEKLVFLEKLLIVKLLIVMTAVLWPISAVVASV